MQRFFINGSLVESDQAAIFSVDSSFLFGLGVFETFLWRSGQLFELDLHSERLLNSIEVVFNQKLTKATIGDMLNEFVAPLDHAQVCRVRLTVSKGSFLTFTLKADPYEPQTNAGELGLSAYRVNEYAALVGHKSTSYANFLLASKQAKSAGFDDALLLNTSSMLCECGTANLFFLKDNQWFTPSLESGCLPGIMRSLVIEALRKEEQAIVEGLFPLETLLEAEAVFITSSLRRVQAISRIEDTDYSSSSNDAVRRLSEKYGY